MIVKDVKIQNKGNRTILSAECKIRKIGWDTLYFSIDSDKADFVASDASPFAAALLIPAMRLRQDLIIHGSVSEALLNGMDIIMDEVMKWGIHVHKIHVKADTVTKDEFKPNKTGSFFTGGVDSFYTYLKHRKDKEKRDRIDSLLFVKGYDIKLDDTDLWNLTFKNLTDIAKAEHVDLVTVETNLRDIIEPMLLWDFIWFYPWDYIHGSALAAVGLFLRKSFQQIYIPSTFSVQEQLPWGSHMDIDKHWGTETLSFNHDGTELTRLYKILNVVSKSKVALDHLRVCYVNPKGLYNCGSCDKCLRTMTAFYAAGVLHKMPTFPHTFDLNRVAHSPLHLGDGELIVYGEMENLQALRDRNLDPDLQKAIELGIANAKSKKSTSVDKAKIEILKVKAKLEYFDHAYLRGKTHSVVHKLSSPQ
jgi:hypothetical protein